MRWPSIFGKRIDAPRPREPWSLDTVLFEWGSAEPFTLDDACRGVQVWGMTGSGKSSGSGKSIALNYLRHGFGGLVLCAKPGEAETWRDYCRRANRGRDLVEFAPSNPFRFNFLDYELGRPGAGAGLTENLLQLFLTVSEIASRSSGSAGIPSPAWRGRSPGNPGPDGVENLSAFSRVEDSHPATAFGLFDPSDRVRRDIALILRPTEDPFQSGDCVASGRLPGRMGVQPPCHMEPLLLTRHQAAVTGAEVLEVVSVLLEGFRLVLPLAGIEKKIAERGDRLVHRTGLHLPFIGHQPTEGPIGFFLVVLAFDKLDLFAFAADRDLGVPPTVEFAEEGFLRHDMSPGTRNRGFPKVHAPGSCNFCCKLGKSFRKGCRKT